MHSAPELRRLATVTVPAPDLRPEVFLSHARGDARGFWARGHRWVAHRGIAAELKPDGDSSSDRFGLVAERASRIALKVSIARREVVVAPGCADLALIFAGVRRLDPINTDPRRSPKGG